MFFTPAGARKYGQQQSKELVKQAKKIQKLENELRGKKESGGTMARSLLGAKRRELKELKAQAKKTKQNIFTFQGRDKDGKG